MSHEFRTTPSKLDCALPTLHPKHSNARGAINRVGYGPDGHRAISGIDLSGRHASWGWVHASVGYTPVLDMLRNSVEFEGTWRTSLLKGCPGARQRVSRGSSKGVQGLL